MYNPASAAHAAAVNPNSIKMVLVNVLSTFPIKSKPGFSNGWGSLPTNPPNCNTLDSWVFESFILADEAFAKSFTNPWNLCIN